MWDKRGNRGRLALRHPHAETQNENMTGSSGTGPTEGKYAQLSGFGEDDEAELIAGDLGISGGGASAEEAAVHIIEDDPDR